jgi:hypothetical protein
MNSRFRRSVTQTGQGHGADAGNSWATMNGSEVKRPTRSNWDSPTSAVLSSEVRPPNLASTSRTKPRNGAARPCRDPPARGRLAGWPNVCVLFR